MALDGHADHRRREGDDHAGDREVVVAHVDAVVVARAVVARVLVVEADKGEGAVRLDGRAQRDLVARRELG